MNPKTLLAAALVVLSMGLAGGASAQSIAERVDRAQERIEQGIRTGQLSRDEAHRLKREFRQVKDDEDRARADGHLDQRERKRLNAELDRLERHIWKLKRNEYRR
jgi:septal ring factor EnvC (AmiA/AmiB activator)